MLAKFLHSFPEQLKREVALELLASTRIIKDEEVQAQILKYVAPCVSEPLLFEIVQIGRTMLHEKYKTQTLIASLPYLNIAAQNQMAREILSSMRTIPRHMVDSCFVIHVLRVLAPHHPAPRLIEEAVERAMAIKPSNFQANALADLVLHVSEPEKNIVIGQLAAMVGNIGLESKRIVLTALNPALAQLPTPTLYSHWRTILHGLGANTRQDFLIGLSIVAPIIFALGGEHAVIEISEHISRVSDWWK